MGANLQQTGQGTQAASKYDLKQRCYRAIIARVPESVRYGSANESARYRELAVIAGAYVRSGANRSAAAEACRELERIQREATAPAARGPACGDTRRAQVPTFDTPPSNTGVNNPATRQGVGQHGRALARDQSRAWWPSMSSPAKRGTRWTRQDVEAAK